MSAAQRNELPKSYSPAAVEAEVYDFWLKNDCFTADPSKAGDPYCIVLPPPNVTGALHLGHGMSYTLQDVLTRYHRMRGFNTLWVPGLDHAGIATQAVVEKQLKENENKTRHDVGRDGLLERIWAWKQQYGDRILSQLQRLGFSCDWTRTRFTLDEQCARAVRETFFKLFKDGLIYRGKRLVNWDTHLLTSISDDELYTETVKTSMWSIKYPIDGTDQFMTVATTRPETMLADTAVAVHPDDPRWNWAIGKQVRLPLTHRLIPIIGDPILVDMAFGSGVVKVTPAHDPNDYAVYTRHQGKTTEIAILNLMTPDGKVNDADPSWAAYSGLTFAAARKKVVEDLTAGGFHNPETDVKPHEANVSFSDRSKTAIQPYLSDQWFVKMAPLAEPALEVVRDGTIKFYPERHAQQYLSWLGEKRDWPISRQLWWGHRIPVWHFRWFTGDDDDKSADMAALREETLRQSVEELSRFQSLFNIDGQISVHGSAHTSELWACGQTAEAQDALNRLAVANARWKAGARPRLDLVDPGLSDEQGGYIVALASSMYSEIIQDPDVLDTWFSSALWPHSTLGWPDQAADLAKWYPNSVLLTGRDIITLWVARMVMMGIYNMTAPLAPGSAGVQPGQSPGLADKAIPFRHVAINPTILDGKGERMSKSKGNGVDPVDIIDTHGADALRFTLTQMATETQDARLPVKKNADGKNTSDKFDTGRNFCSKLYNAAKFVLSNLETAGAAATVSDELQWSLAERWIVSRFNRTVEEANTALAIYRFDQYARACYDFFWRDFCDWYVEASKPAIKDPARRGQTALVLASVLDGVLRLMHPIIPFITERLWWELNAVCPARGLPGRLECPPSDKLISAAWPAVGDFSQASEFIFPRIQEIIIAVRNVKNQYNAKQAVAVQITAPAEPSRQIETNRELIEFLTPCRITLITPETIAPVNAARTTAAGVEIFVLDMIDPQAEQQRKIKERDALVQKITTLRNRMSSPSYTEKAPAHLVKQTRNELNTLEAELAKTTAEGT